MAKQPDLNLQTVEAEGPESRAGEKVSVEHNKHDQRSTQNDPCERNGTDCLFKAIIDRHCTVFKDSF